MFRRRNGMNAFTALSIGIGIGMAASRMMKNGGGQFMNMMGQNDQNRNQQQ